MKADLHVHTSASDGRLSPEKVVQLAVELGLDAIAITDHDTVDGVISALRAARDYPSFVVVPGVEINTDIAHGEVHILGYFIDYTYPALESALQKLRTARRARAKAMIAKLAELGMDIEWGRVEALASGKAICRPHIAQALLEVGYVNSEREAFEKYIGHDCPAYVERYKLPPEEAVRLVSASRGLPVLAHPADIDNLENFVRELKKCGLIGMEVYYRDYDTEIAGRLLDIANKYHLIPTGGTDYHAFSNESEVMLGAKLTPPDSLEKLFSLANPRSLQLLQTVNPKLQI